MNDVSISPYRKLRQREASARYRAKNRDLIKQKFKEWASKNRKRLAAYKRDWVARNQDKVRALKQSYYQRRIQDDQFHEHKKQKNREWRSKNKDKCSAQYKARRKANHKLFLAKERAYKLKHRDKLREQQNSRRKKDPGRRRRQENERYYKNREHILSKTKAWSKKQTAAISDNYVKTIVSRTGIPRDFIPPRVIETQRLLIMIKRSIKEKLK